MEEKDRVSIDPTVVVLAADGLRRQGDEVASLSVPASVEVVVPTDRYAWGEALGAFEAARSRFDGKVFETLRSVSEHLSAIAVDSIRADNIEFVPLPEAGQ